MAAFYVINVARMISTVFVPDHHSNSVILHRPTGSCFPYCLLDFRKCFLSTLLRRWKSHCGFCCTAHNATDRYFSLVDSTESKQNVTWFLKKTEMFPAETPALFVLGITCGGFILLSVFMCCIRVFVYLTNDKKFLCFKSQEAIRRARIQLSLLPEVHLQCPECPDSVGYIAAPDENINEHTICQPYVYEDGRSTGMRTIANLPLALAFTSRTGIPAESIFGIQPQFTRSPNLSQNSERYRPTYEELPPPAYSEAQFCDSRELDKCSDISEPPPPKYDECMKQLEKNVASDNENDETGSNDKSSQ